MMQLEDVAIRLPDLPPLCEEHVESWRTMPRGATVAELARTIHKELQQQLKSARVWGHNVFDGQTVQGEHVLDEGDVVELHV